MIEAAPSVVAVVGSPRLRGNTAALVDVALAELAARGAACESIVLSRLAVAPCLAHETCAELAACAIGDDAAEVLDRVYAADCLILGTPVYYENVSAQLKALIDRSYFPYVHGRWLRAKAVGLVVVSAETGLQETVDALRRYVALSSDGDIPVFTCAGYADEAGAAAADDELVAEARRLGAELAGELGLSRA
jgi:multimeric flavodoxin WrbA